MDGVELGCEEEYRIRRGTFRERRCRGTRGWSHGPSESPFPWAPDSRVGSPLTSARSETMDAKPSFRKAFATIRPRMPILIPTPERGRWLDPEAPEAHLRDLLLGTSEAGEGGEG